MASDSVGFASPLAALDDVARGWAVDDALPDTVALIPRGLFSVVRGEEKARRHNPWSRR